MNNADIVRRFENEFKNQSNLDVVDELMTEGFVHHLPYQGLPEGRAGMKAVGHAVTGSIREIHVTIDLMLTDGDFVADRISAHGVRKDNNQPTDWVEDHIYRLNNGQIAELWPAGGPTL